MYLSCRTRRTTSNTRSYSWQGIGSEDTGAKHAGKSSALSTADKFQMKRAPIVLPRDVWGAKQLSVIMGSRIPKYLIHRSTIS